MSAIPGWQQWEKSAARMMDAMVRDPFVLNTAGRAMQMMLHGKIAIDRVTGVRAFNEMEDLKARLSTLEARVKSLEGRNGAA